MNDFTKEDLLAMGQCLRMAYKSGFDTEDGLPTAFYCYDKIQSMIENYCKHETNVWPLYTRTGDIPVAGFCYECNTSVIKGLISE